MYEKLDKINEEVTELEEELKALHKQANIFEQPVTEFKQIKLVRRELKLLKNLWDYVNIVLSSLDEWKTTVWKKIDVEGMDQECKKLVRELRRKCVPHAIGVLGITPRVLLEFQKPKRRGFKMKIRFNEQSRNS